MLKEISPSLATPFGDMSSYGGLAAAFDNAKFKGAASCSGKNSALTAYVGLHDQTPRAIAKVEIRGSQDYGYCGGDALPITFNLRASMIAPTNSSDGALLGSISITNYHSLGNRVRAIFSNDIETAWAYRWVEQITSVPTTMLLGLQRYYEPYAAETVSVGPDFAISSLSGLVAESDGGDNSKMWISCREATLVNPVDGTTMVLRTPMNYRCATLSGFSGGETVWAWQTWDATNGLRVIWSRAAPPYAPSVPPGTFVRHLFPVVLDGAGKIRSADHPVSVKDDTFYYSSGDYVPVFSGMPMPPNDLPIDLSAYVPVGVSRATIYFDPEIATTSGLGYTGFFPKTGEGGNFAIVMVYAMTPAGHGEGQMPIEMPMNDDRILTFGFYGTVGNVTGYGLGYQLQSYRF